MEHDDDLPANGRHCPSVCVIYPQEILPPGQELLCDEWLGNDCILIQPRCVPKDRPGYWQEWYGFKNVTQAGDFYRAASDMLRLNVLRGGGKPYTVWLGLRKHFWYCDGIVSAGIGFLSDNLETVNSDK